MTCLSIAVAYKRSSNSLSSSSNSVGNTGAEVRDLTFSLLFLALGVLALSSLLQTLSSYKTTYCFFC